MKFSFALQPSPSMQAKIVENKGNSYGVDVRTNEGFVHVKLAWIFLGIVLLGSAVVFPVFKFNPPK